jgi:hypothetical protein
MHLPSLRTLLPSASLAIAAGLYIHRSYNMSSLSVLRAFSALKLSTASKTNPLGIFVGGTSGIGQGIAEAFARHTDGNAHIMYVCSILLSFSLHFSEDT